MAPRWDTRYSTCIASLNAEATNWSRRKKREYLQNTAVIWRDLCLRTLVLDDSDRFKFVEREPNVNNNSNNGGQQDGLLGGDDEVEQEIHGGVDIGGQLENEGEDSDSQEDFDSEGQQNNEGRQLGGDNDVEQDIYGGGDIGGHLG